MFTDREQAEMSARIRFQRMREEVAAGEEAFVAVRMAEYDDQKARWDSFDAAGSARREHVLGGAA
jgi:hypothetical protein